MMQKTVDRPSTESHEESDMLHKHSQWDCGRIFYFIFSFLLLHMKHIGEEKIFLGLVSCQLSNAQDDIIGRTEKIIKLRRAQSWRNIKICAKNFHCENSFSASALGNDSLTLAPEWLLTKKSGKFNRFQDSADLWWKSVRKSRSSLKIDEKALLTTSEVERHGGTCLLICRLAVDSATVMHWRTRRKTNSEGFDCSWPREKFSHRGLPLIENTYCERK